LTDFSSLGLAEPILRAVAHEGYDTPTPIQAQSIPALLGGRDLLGIAQTGTGKTAAFALPILQHLSQLGRARPKTCQALVLAPTRELAAQIADSFRTYGRNLRLSVAVVVGGVSYGPQIQALTRGVDVLVATPGRLLDHMQTGAVRLDATKIVVLDEADHMLDLGFLVPIRRIIKALPAERQNLFFSATMPREIDALAADMLRDPVRVAVTPMATTADRVNQHVYLVDGSGKRPLLVELLSDPKLSRTLVFTKTKRGADRVTEHLEDAGISAAAIHGNKSQGQREKALAAFKAGRVRVLVATDIAARGIDVDAVTHVVNFELPHVPESYVHRIGRTARAGAAGEAISFCENAERGLLRDIERTTRQQIPVTDRRTGGGGGGGEARGEQRKERSGHHGGHRNAARGAGTPGGHSHGSGQAHGNGHGHGAGQGRGAGAAKPGGAPGQKRRPRRRYNNGGGGPARHAA
jgi:ATP-dependent RNA helicase RhlE